MTKFDEDFLRTPGAYDAFVQVWEDLGIESVPTFDQWLQACDETQNSHLETLEETYGVGFTPPANLGATIAAGTAALKTMGISVPDKESLIAVAGQRLKSEVQRFANRSGSRVYQTYGDNTPTGGGDGGTSEANFIGGSPWNPTGLSDKNPVLSANFDTDIRFVGAEKYFLDGDEGNIPLLVKCGIPGVFSHGGQSSSSETSTGDHQLYNYFLSAVYNEFRSEIAKRVIVNTQVESLFTPTNIQAYYNACLQALMVYYFWMSVLAYTNDSRNKNGAMDVLIDGLSVTERDNLLILQRTIEQSVIPPFLHKWCFYIMGNYKQSFMPGAPMLKILPWKFASVGSTATGSVVNAHTFTSLYTTSGSFGMITNATYLLREHRGMQDILARAYPEWCSPSLLMYDSTPKFDANFLQFWKNGFYICGGAVTTGTGSAYVSKLLPEVTVETDPITYCADTDAPDGWVQAMQCLNHHDSSSGNNTVGPGFFNGTIITVEQTSSTDPTLEIRDVYATSNYVASGAQISSTCLVYDGSTSITGFRDVAWTGTSQKLAQNTYSSTVSAVGVKEFQQFGTSLIKLQNKETIRQSCFAWYDLVASDLKGSSVNSRSKRSSNYSRKGGKMKDNSSSDKS